MLEGKELGETIRLAMEMKGVTQQQVATEFGIKQPSVSDMLKHGRIAKRHHAGFSLSGRSVAEKYRQCT